RGTRRDGGAARAERRGGSRVAAAVGSAQRAAAGDAESPDQCARRDTARRRHPRGHARPRRRRGARGDRHGLRHSRSGAEAHLRSVRHHEGAAARHRARALHLRADRARPRRPHRRRERARARQHVPRDPARRAGRRMSPHRPAVLVADDDAVARALLVGVLEREGYRVRAAGGGAEAIELAEHELFDVALVDLRMPEVDGLAVLERLLAREPAPAVLILTAFAAMDTAIEAIRRGAYDYLSKPFRLDEIKRAVRRTLEVQRLARDNQRYRRELRERFDADRLVGHSPEIVAIYKLIARVAALDTTVLIQGETGTGKELVARAIHYTRRRPRARLRAARVAGPLLRVRRLGPRRGGSPGRRHPPPRPARGRGGGPLLPRRGVGAGGRAAGKAAGGP